MGSRPFDEVLNLGPTLDDEFPWCLLGFVFPSSDSVEAWSLKHRNGGSTGVPPTKL